MSAGVVESADYAIGPTYNDNRCTQLFKQLLATRACNLFLSPGAEPAFLPKMFDL